MRHRQSQLVSIVVPTYNHELYVRESLLSAIHQDYPNVELIVIDDGSSDATPEIVEEVLANCRIPCQFVRQENREAHNAINRGMRLAEGDYIAILNSDDIYHRGRLSRLIEIAEETETQFLFSKVRHIGKDGRSLPSSSPAIIAYQESLRMIDKFPTPKFELLRYNFAITTGNFVIARALYERVGGFSEYSICHDWDFLLKAMIYKEPLFVDEVLLDYRLHGANEILRADPGERLHETEQLIFSYLEMAEYPENKLAPCLSNWGSYWNYFVRTYMQHHPFLSEGETEPTGTAKRLARGSSEHQRGKVQEPLAFKGDDAQSDSPWQGNLENPSPHKRDQVNPKWKNHAGQDYLATREILLVEMIERLEKSASDIEAERQKLSQRVSQLEEWITGSDLPPLPARTYLYFAVRKMLYPIYVRIGGDRNRLLYMLKAWIKGEFTSRDLNL